jgi:hypothetical protein
MARDRNKPLSRPGGWGTACRATASYGARLLHRLLGNSMLNKSNQTLVLRPHC